MKSAESKLQKPKKKFAWSPKLRNAGIIKRHWRLRLQEAQHKGHHPLLLLTIRKHLNKATKYLREQQKRATLNRFKTYHDLLATYSNDTNPITHPESNTKAKKEKRTMKMEPLHNMFTKVRTTVKNIFHSRSSGLNQVTILTINSTSGNINLSPENFQEYISSTPNETIEWETILDQEEIEDYLLNTTRTHPEQ